MESVSPSARAYDNYVNDGVVAVPRRDNTAAPAALALVSLAASAHAHAGAGAKRSKRAGSLPTPASPSRKRMRLDPSAGAVVGGWGGLLVVAAQGPH